MNIKKQLKKIGIIKMLLSINILFFYSLFFAYIFFNTKKIIMINILISIILIFFYGVLSLIKDIKKM